MADQHRLGGSTQQEYSRYSWYSTRRQDVEIDEPKIQKGLLQNGKVLEFVHDRTALIHKNLLPEAIMVNAKFGIWKMYFSTTVWNTHRQEPLGGFQILQYFVWEHLNLQRKRRNPALPLRVLLTMISALRNALLLMLQQMILQQLLSRLKMCVMLKSLKLDND
ncbi:Protein kinase domain-containing protein ppk32 [Rhizina undulata]